MQAKILSISDEQEKVVLYLLIACENRSYKKKIAISVEQYDTLGCPSPDDILTEAQYKALVRSAKKAGNAKDAAMNILSYSDNNEKNLTKKLLRKGFSQEEASEAARQMKERGYIDEYDQVYRYVLSLANQKKMGARKIYPYLLNRGYCREDIERALSCAVECGDIDFEKIKLQLILKHRPQDEKEEKALLFKHGFYSSQFDDD